MQTEEQTFELDVGTYTGPISPENRPHGRGVLAFLPDDPMGRLRYEGDFEEGTKTGAGAMTFASGDKYEGGFRDGVPHGEGRFTYSDGQEEAAAWEDGERHGLSRCRTPGGTEEEIMFWEGEARGPGKITKPDGSVEERTYENGKYSRDFLFRLFRNCLLDLNRRFPLIFHCSPYQV